MINKPLWLIVHHTGGTDSNPLSDSSYFTFEQCNELHKKKFDFPSSLGFYVGYHYYIDRDGKVTQARSDTDEGAHTIGYNLTSLGICLAGNFDVTSPTPQQVVALGKLLKEKSDQYNIPKYKIVPHRTFAKKTCYGNNLSDTWAADLVSNSGIIAKLGELLSELFSLINKKK